MGTKKVDFELEVRSLAHQVEQITKTDDPLVILVRGAILMDRALQYMLDEYLIEGLKQFEPYRLSFAGYTVLAYSIGLITAHEKAMMDAVRELRNRVAHRVDVVVTKDDEAKLLDEFLKHGFTRPQALPMAMDIVFKGLGVNFTDDRPFKDLRHMVIYLVVMLNSRNGERPAGTITGFTPPKDDTYLANRHLSAMMLVALLPPLNDASEEDRNRVFKSLAEVESKARELRLNPQALPPVQQPPSA